MKFVYATFLALIFVNFLAAQTLTPVDSASNVSFRIKNLGFNTTGSFSGLAGYITFDPAHPGGCSFDVHIDAKTVNSGNDMRDDHIRAGDFLDVKNFPQIRFVSVKVSPAKKNGTLFVSGNLTLKGVTREVTFPFTAQPIQDGYLFNGEFTINRRDFKVGGGSTVSDDLTVLLKVVARRT